MLLHDITSETIHPFSFTYAGKPSDEWLSEIASEKSIERLDKARARTTTSWTDPGTGLRVIMEAISYSDFPAVDWVLYFANIGSEDTPVIENIQAADLTLDSPLAGWPYILHKTHGGTCDPQQFEAAVVKIGDTHWKKLCAGAGRSSVENFPFFKVETAESSIIMAVGWSGCWEAWVKSVDRQLQITAGMEKTHFILHPGEKVRSPRILLFQWPGETLESNAQFRQLIYKHYAAKRSDEDMLPVLFCNTCFTRKGGWLNECNAENQISLIKAYAPLGLEALLTDAGWFEGGWPAGAGNWNPRKDAYPDGIGPVAASAKEHGMIYGLWFEPERVVANTDIHRMHPEWCLASQSEPEDTYLLNFGLPEVQNYFFNIVKEFMELPGFRFYRQDFNMDPLPYWRYNDAPDRQGITEIKYIEGLYAYWDRIAQTWPDSLREECASGGLRFDLETIMRMHIHQKTDHWFDNEVDQASIWGLSAYIPNNVFVAPIDRMDYYTLHSVMATSLCMGWIADAPDFNVELGKKMLDRYNEVKHLLIGAWYPLTVYSREMDRWLAMQYHRSDLDEGMVLAFRRPESPYPSLEVALSGLDSEAQYRVSFDSTGETIQAKGSELMKCFTVHLPDKHSSDLIVYKRV